MKRNTRYRQPSGYLLYLLLLAASMPSALAQEDFSYIQMVVEERFVQLPANVDFAALSEYEKSHVASMREKVRYRRVTAYDREKGFRNETIYVDPEGVNPWWFERPIARVVESEATLTAYDTDGDLISEHEIVMEGGSAREKLHHELTSGLLHPFKTHLRLNESELEALIAEGYTTIAGYLTRRGGSAENLEMQNLMLPGGVVSYDEGHVALKKGNHTLTFDEASNTEESTWTNDEGLVTDRIIRMYGRKTMSSGETAFVERAELSTRLDTTVSGVEIVRVRLNRSLNHEYNRGGALVFGNAAQDSPQGLLVFPNPLADDRIFVVVPDGIDNAPYDISVYAMDGRKLSSRKASVPAGGILTLSLKDVTTEGPISIIIDQEGKVFRQVAIKQ